MGKEALTRDGRHDREAQSHEFMDVAHQFDGLLRRLAEAWARVDANAVVRDARAHERIGALAQPRAHIIDHVGIGGCILHGVGRALHMHDHQARIARARHLHHSRVAEPRHVVDDAGARFHRTTGHLGVTRIHRYADALRRQLCHHIPDAVPFLGRCHLARARTRGFATHVDDGSALFHHLARMGHCRFHIGELAPVAERVRGNVQHAHDDGRASVELVCVAFPDHEAQPFFVSDSINLCGSGDRSHQLFNAQNVSRETHPSLY